MDKIEKIRKEIERLKSTNPSEYNYQNAEGYIWALDDLLSFLDTLSEEPVCLYDGEAPSKQKCGDCTIACSVRVEEEPNKSLEEEINRYLEPIHAADIQFEPFTQMTKCARHFAEWGRKQVLQEIYEGKVEPVDKITAAWLDDESKDK